MYLVRGELVFNRLKLPQFIFSHTVMRESLKPMLCELIFFCRSYKVGQVVVDLRLIDFDLYRDEIQSL